LQTYFYKPNILETSFIYLKTSL